MNNIITLKDASGTDIEFKMLDQFTHEERTYVVLMPHNESTTQVSIYEVVPTKDEGVDGLLGITPELTNVLFEVFIESYPECFIGAIAVVMSGEEFILVGIGRFFD